MRTTHTIRNIGIGLASQVILIALGFISRKVFLDSLGVEYLGIDGLMTNVLSILALAEGGIGTSIVYQLYKPLAEGNKDRIIALVHLYRKLYCILALFTLAVSLSLYPFLGHLMKNGTIVSGLSIIFFIYVAKNVISYLNAHKWSLINADQRGYVLARMNLVFQIGTMIVKIVVLVWTGNYMLYLLMDLSIFAIQNIVNGKMVDRRYAYIKTKVKHTVDPETSGNLKKNVKAMFLHNIGGYMVFGTDNLLISSFVGLAAVGQYSNYSMILSQLSAFVKPVLGGMGASVGNLIATEGREKNYAIFEIAYFLNFWVISACVVFLYSLLEPFLSWWLGSQYLLGRTTFLLLLVNFYLMGMRTSILTFKSKAGLFVQDKYIPLVEAAINLIASIGFARMIGLPGIFLGTVISTLATVFWTQPVIVYRSIFQMPIRRYFVKYLIYAAVTLGAGWVSSEVCSVVTLGAGLVALIVKGVVCLAVSNAVYFAVFFRTKEMQYLLQFARRIAGSRIRGKRAKEQSGLI